MSLDLALKLQKKGIMMHRLVFVVFFLQRIALQMVYKNLPWKNTILMMVFIALCAAMEEGLAAFQAFDNLWVLRIIRFVQCSICSVMIIFTEDSTDSGTMVLALLIMFVVDMALTFDITDKAYALGSAAALGLVLLIVMLIKMKVYKDNEWMFMFFAAVLIGLVLICEAFAFAEYIKYKDQELLDERRRFETIVEKNENILNMQYKLRNTNDQLNIQKIDLQRANKQIKEANEEMKVQEEIMRYIASSFDMPSITERIVDSVMEVKKLGFCAVYIKENVYNNKERHYVIKSKIHNLEDVIRQHMEEIFFRMKRTDSSELIIHNNFDDMEYLKEFNINSVYIKVLGDKNDKYGLLMVGDSRRNLFEDNLSFYKAITAQSNIAVNNVKIYNNMQHLARTDGLTGINNRIYFNELFKETADKIKEKNGAISVALFDIDKFKNVNDTYGHLAGDEVIKRIASVTAKHMEENDGFICRYGGEEFVVVLPDKNLSEAEPIIKALFDKLCEQVVTYNANDIKLSVSVGLTSYPEVCSDTDELLKRADWCMYYAKEHGRHQLKLDDGKIEKQN